MRSSQPIGRVITSLYVLEFAALLCVLMLQKRGERPLLVFLAAYPGAVFVAGLVAMLAAGIVLVQSLRSSYQGGTRWFGLAVAVNAVTVIVMLALGETATRLLSSSTPDGIAVAGVRLLPRS
jgi:ABC-type multidrug transport system permease subunit